MLTCECNFVFDPNSTSEPITQYGPITTSLEILAFGSIIDDGCITLK